MWILLLLDWYGKMENLVHIWINQIKVVVQKSILSILVSVSSIFYGFGSWLNIDVMHFLSNFLLGSAGIDRRKLHMKLKLRKGNQNMKNLWQPTTRNRWIFCGFRRSNTVTSSFNARSLSWLTFILLRITPMTKKKSLKSQSPMSMMMMKRKLGR